MVSFDGEHLFEDEVLARVMAESKEDSVVSANIAFSKAVSFPVFGVGKSGGKASSDQASSTSPLASTPRGRGRGAGDFWLGRGRRLVSLLLRLVESLCGSSFASQG